MDHLLVRWTAVASTDSHHICTIIISLTKVVYPESISSTPDSTAPTFAPSPATVLVARLARVVRQRFEQSLTPLGLRQRHVVALSYLRGHGPTAQQTLAEQLCMDASSLVCLLNQLEDEDLVVRRRDRADRRRGLIELSPRGAEALAEVDHVLRVVDDEVLGPLSPDEQSTLHRLLARLTSGEPDWGLAGDEA